MKWLRSHRRAIGGPLAGVSVVLLTVVALGGCSKNVELPPPPISSYQRIAIAPLITPTPLYGMLTARDLGNQLQIALKNVDEDIEVIFDESQELRPVTDAIRRLNLQPDEVYADPKLAAKVAEALNADVIIIGRMNRPRIETREDGRQVFDMSAQAGISGTTRYTIIWQQAVARVWAKVVSQTGEVLWQSGTTPPKEPAHISAYLRYARAFQAQVPAKAPVEEDVILAHMRDHVWRLLAHAIHPDHFPEIKVPVWKEKPAQQFKTSGGIVRFE